MELTPIKYKQTEVGMIPEDWYLSEIESFSVITIVGVLKHSIIQLKIVAFTLMMSQMFF